MQSLADSKADAAPNRPAQRSDGRRMGFFRRIYEAFIRSRQEKADREIALWLGLSGGRLTDEIERRLSEHITGRRNFRP